MFVGHYGPSLAAKALKKTIPLWAVFIAVQWPFADFLMSPQSRNWVFGTNYFDYNMPLWSPYANFQFIPAEATAGQFWRRMLLAGVTVWAMMWVGLRAGRAMERVRR